MQISDEMISRGAEALAKRNNSKSVEAFRGIAAAVLEAALSAAEPSVAVKNIAITADINNGDDNWIQVTLSGPGAGQLTEDQIESALTAQVQDVAEEPDVLWTCHNNMSNMFFGPGATENENEVVWDFADRSWANANIKLTVFAAPAKQADTPLQKKVAEELKPLREAMENSTGKWERP